MSRRLVQFETGVTAPDGYRELVTEYVYTCDMCQRERETLQVEQDLCEDCLMIHEAAPELLEQLHALRRWLQSQLETNVIHRSTGKGGHDGDGNSWSAVAIPEWDVRQKIDALEKAITAATGQSGKPKCEHCNGTGQFPAWSAAQGDHIEICDCEAGKKKAHL